MDTASYQHSGRSVCMHCTTGLNYDGITLKEKDGGHFSRVLHCRRGSELAWMLCSCAGRAEVGLELGSKLIEPLPAMQHFPFAMDGGAGCQAFYLHESHQDQISELPKGATLLASSANTPIEVWSQGTAVLGIQGLPYMLDVLARVMEPSDIMSFMMAVENYIAAEF